MAAEGGSRIIRFTYTGEGDDIDIPLEATQSISLLPSESLREEHSLGIPMSLKLFVVKEWKRLMNMHCINALP